MKKKILASLLALCMALTLLPVPALAKEGAVGDVLAENTVVLNSESSGNYAVLVNEDGSYSVESAGNVILEHVASGEPITFTGENSEIIIAVKPSDPLIIRNERYNTYPVDIILCDLRCNSIQNTNVVANYELVGETTVKPTFVCTRSDVTIDGMGSLSASGWSGNYGTGQPGLCVDTYYDIDGTRSYGTSQLTINGGDITTSGKDGSQPGIGPSNYVMGGRVVINGGKVKATGGAMAAGIGAGLHKMQGVEINGGYVVATGGMYASAIGAGMQGNGGNGDSYAVHITGGTVIANAGIGRRNIKYPYSYSIGRGSETPTDGMNANVIIDGGALYTTSKMIDQVSEARNSDGDALGQVMFYGLPEETAIAELIINGKAYGTCDARTNSLGELVVWAPIGEDGKITLNCQNKNYGYSGNILPGTKIECSDSGDRKSVFPYEYEDQTLESDGKYSGAVTKWASRLTLNANRGAGTPATVDVPEGQRVTLPTPTREGYDFGGWYEEPTYQNVVVENSIPMGSATVYARWNKPTGEGNADIYTVLPQIDNQVYAASALKPTPSVLKNGMAVTEGYTVEYADNTDVGTASVIVKVGDAVIGTAAFEILPAAVEIKAEDKSMVKDNVLPAFTHTVSGLLGDDGLTGEPTLTCTADGKTVGEYDIVPSGADAGGNYSITYVNGTLTVENRQSGGSSGPSVGKAQVAHNEGGTATAKSDGTVTITPDEEYQIEKITVNGKEVAIPASHKLTGLRAGDKVVITFVLLTEIKDPEVPLGDMPFVDVGAEDWFYGAVTYVYNKGLMKGIGDTVFEPYGGVTRATVWTVLYRAAGSPAANADDSSWYAAARSWAIEKGISDGSDPEGLITREQLAAMLYRHAGSPAVSGMALSEFSDSQSVSDWAKDAMLWAVKSAIVTGKDGGELKAQDGASRAEAATMLMRRFQAAES